MTTAFDQITDTYDQDFTHHPVGWQQRQCVWKYWQIMTAQPPKRPLRILELNCGTGTDALFFAQQGHQVWATDVSQQMVEQTTSKVKEKGYMNQIQVQQMGIETITPTTFEHPFDVIFSNFGGFNCLSAPQIQRFAQLLPYLLKPDGRLLMVVMPSFCVWESLYFSVKGDWEKVWRRKQKSALLANVGKGSMLPIWYYSPKQFITFFQPYIQLNKLLPVGIILPPTCLLHLWNKESIGLKLLKLGEQISSRFSSLATYADHFLVDMQLR